MTLLRAPGSWEAALFNALHDLTDREITAATGKTRAAFDKASQPTSRAGLHFHDAALLDRALVAKGMQPVFLPLFRDLMGEAPAPAACINQGLRRLGAEVGEVNATVEQALGDGSLDRLDRHAIAKELHDVVACARRLIASLEAEQVGSVTPLAGRGRA